MSSFVKQGTDCSDGTYKVTCRLSIWYYAHISYVFLILWKWDGKLSWELLCNDLGSQLQSTWWWISFHDKEPQTRWLETTEDAGREPGRGFFRGWWKCSGTAMAAQRPEWAACCWTVHFQMVTFTVWWTWGTTTTLENEEEKAVPAEFPGGPLVRMWCFRCREHGFHPWSEN